MMQTCNRLKISFCSLKDIAALPELATKPPGFIMLGETTKIEARTAVVWQMAPH